MNMLGSPTQALSSAEVAAVPTGSSLFSTFLLAASSLNIASPYYPKQASVQDHQSFDFVVVGAGSAGCVVANRLTENGNWSVLLIEAGGDPPYHSTVPGLFPFLYQSPTIWDYRTVNDHYSSQAHKTQNVRELLGKVFGGTSSVNLMFYVRGNKDDYENCGWDWETVTTYFKKSERLDDDVIMSSDSASYHNTKGYLGVTRPDWGDETKKYFDAFKENGHDILVDYNANQPLGYSPPQFTIDDHIRQSTATAFLSPIRDRANLYVLKNTLARKVIFEGKRAVGVEIKLPNGKVIYVKANKEVILSTGAFESPHLLMLSGVGPKQHLEEMDIPVVLDSPNVGQNLQDHSTVIVTLTGKKGFATAIQNIDPVLNLDTFPLPIVMGLVTLNKSQTYPDYQSFGIPLKPGTLFSTLLCTYIFQLDDEICTTLANAGQTQEILLTLLPLLHPESRGQVKLRSKDPEEDPLIYTGYYSNENDLEKHARSVEDYVSVLNTTYFKSVKSEIVDYNVTQCRSFELFSHEYWKCFVLNLGQTLWHNVGTCSMGAEGEGVVDERFRVRGVERLRVVDASVISRVPSANTNAATIMVAEMASDTIKVDHGVIT